MYPDSHTNLPPPAPRSALRPRLGYVGAARGTLKRDARSRNALTRLAENATIVVVGGGPAESFFAIRLLRRARETGRAANVIILEKKTEVWIFPEFVHDVIWNHSLCQIRHLT